MAGIEQDMAEKVNRRSLQGRLGQTVQRLLAVAVILVLLNQQAVAHTGHGHDHEAETELRIALELNPKDVDTRNRLARVLHLRNKFEQAEREYAAVLKLAPDNPDAHDGMGLLRMQTRQYTEAVTWFTRAVALDGSRTLPHFHLGQAYEQLGRPADAGASFRRALATNAALLRGKVPREKEQQNRQMILDALKKLPKTQQTHDARGPRP